MRRRSRVLGPVRQAMGDNCDYCDPASSCADATNCVMNGGTYGTPGSGSSGGVPSTSGSSGSSSSETASTSATSTSTDVNQNWYDSSGICYATTSDGGVTLNLYKEFQRQMNRIASVIGSAAIAVDGAIGPNTLALVGAINSATQTSGKMTALGFSSTSCDTDAATLAASGTAGLQALADGLGAPSSVTSPTGSPQVYNPTTGSLQAQAATASIADVWNNLSSTAQIGLAVGAGVLAYMTLGKRGQKSSAKKTTKAQSRRY
jgi:hypothetical protein